MKNYFESENYIVSFEKVISVIIDGDEIIVYTIQHNIPKTCEFYYKFPLDQLANYKAWLDAQQRASDMLTLEHEERYMSYFLKNREGYNGAEYSGKANDIVLTREQIIKIIDYVDYHSDTMNIRSDDMTKEINELIRDMK